MPGVMVPTPIAAPPAFNRLAPLVGVIVQAATPSHETKTVQPFAGTDVGSVSPQVPGQVKEMFLPLSPLTAT